MKTIDEYMAILVDRIPVLKSGDVHGNYNFLRNTLLEVARDQRHACAEAVLAIRDPNLQWKDIAHQAVMNAEVK